MTDTLTQNPILSRAILRVSSWQQAKRLGAMMARFAFRGQSDERWGLETSILRAGQAFGTPRDMLASRESYMLREFRRRAHHYLGATPEEKANIEWLALLQHYGGCTRLLDFTYSFYIAAFFAIEKSTSDAAVWGIDIFSLEEDAAVKITGKALETLRLDRGLASNYASALVGQVAGSRGIIPIETERLHERLSIQQGLFFMPIDIGSTFDDNLRASLGSLDDNELSYSFEDISSDVLGFVSRVGVLKIILPTTIHRTAIEDLRRMNVTAAALFPGLDGFAQSLQQWLRVPHGNLDGYEDFVELSGLQTRSPEQPDTIDHRPSSE